MKAFLRKIVGIAVLAASALASRADVAAGDVLRFETPGPAGSFVVPAGKYAKVDLALVGGGGAGGTVAADVVKGAAGGGGAGGVFVGEGMVLGPGEYFVNVGAGGQKAQTASMSWVGDDGENTYISFETATNYFVTVKGGGGGGSVKIGGEGTPGASGGGGSWYGSFLRGGPGADGYGWAGGTPGEVDVGGGGGGAGSTGKADGAPGEGRTVWNVVCARGGRGGVRGEQGYEPKDGEGVGFGGDGAVNGFGGKGGDGAVFVKVLKVFEYTDVRVPADGTQGYTFSFLYDGTEKAGFDVAKADGGLSAGLDAVEGTTKATEVGRYKFTVYLRDEYRWTDGSVGPKTFEWRINEPNVVGDITVDVKKTVDWFEGTNATIAIDIHSTPETKVVVPNVLVLGSLCDAHDLTATIVKTTLNTVTDVGNVDYYYFNESADRPSFSGSLAKGQKYNGTVTVKTSNHWTAYGFYSQLWTLIYEGTASKYDYIIFSFDRSRVVGKYTSAHPHEADVVNFLAPFYEKNKVIWLVDKDPENYNPRTGYTITQTPWRPCDLYPYTSGNTTTWRTFRQHISNSTQAYTAYHGMIGLFSPADYSRITQTYWNSNNLGTSLEYTDVANAGKVAGAENPNQVVYDSAKNVADVIETVVKPTAAALEARDQIYIRNGLDINKDLTDAYYTVDPERKDDSWDDAVERWTKLTPEQFKYDPETGTQLLIPEVTQEIWVKMKIGVTDTGRFLTSVDARFNERTGKWEKDPNNGPVQVEMKSASDSVLAEDNASTTVQWAFEAFEITGEVLYGEGEFVINGFYTSRISVAKGYNPEAMFKGAPGWAVSYVEVDGQPIADCSYMTNWFFGQISANHDIKVAFTNIVAEVPPPEIGPTEYVYDGEGHTVETLRGPSFIDGYEEYSNRWYMVYTTDPNASPTNRSEWTSENLATNAGVTTVYARICLEQPGYEDGAIVPYWCGTNTVTINRRPIEITVDDQWQTSGTRIPVSDFTYEQVKGSLVDGDEIVIDYSCAYPSQGNTAPINGTVKIVHRNEDGTTTDVTDNYAVTVNPGTYHYPPANQVVATAPNVVKTYDGVETSTVVTVLNPDHTPTQSEIKAMKGGSNSYNNIRNGNEIKTIEYFVNGAWTTVLPTFTDVGTYEVQYKVSYKYEFEYRQSNWNFWRSDSIEYTPFEGSATVVINKRDVVVTAGTKQKVYDGAALTDGSYTAEGFADGEGLSSAGMTSDSSILNPGSVPNVLDPSKTAFKSNTNPGNYNVSYVDGALTVTDIPGGGGSDGYLDESVRPWIVDHDSGPAGYVYLAFNPRWKGSADVEFGAWLARTAENGGFKMKYGLTREACDACDPVRVELSSLEKHVKETSFRKIWVKVPVENIENVASVLPELAHPMGYVRVFVSAVAFESSSSAKGVGSSNMFGILKYENTKQNVLTAVPWTWYSEAEADAEDIPTRKLVKTTGLADGDRLLQFTKTGTYNALYALDGEWQAAVTVKNTPSGTEISDPKRPNELMDITTGELAIKRGAALWTNKAAAGNTFYTFGQAVATDVETTIKAPAEGEDVCSNPVGNPFAAEVSINDLAFEGEIDANDKVWVPNGTLTAKYLYRKANPAKGGRIEWCETVAAVVNGKRVNTYNYDVKVQAGCGFWYDRRGRTDLKIKWTNPFAK